MTPPSPRALCDFLETGKVSHTHTHTRPAALPSQQLSASASPLCPPGTPSVEQWRGRQVTLHEEKNKTEKGKQVLCSFSRSPSWNCDSLALTQSHSNWTFPYIYFHSLSDTFSPDYHTLRGNNMLDYVNLVWLPKINPMIKNDYWSNHLSPCDKLQALSRQKRFFFSLLTNAQERFHRCDFQIHYWLVLLLTTIRCQQSSSNQLSLIIQKVTAGYEMCLQALGVWLY